MRLDLNFAASIVCDMASELIELVCNGAMPELVAPSLALLETHAGALRRQVIEAGDVVHECVLDTLDHVDKVCTEVRREVDMMQALDEMDRLDGASVCH